jgi:hypothetical protein
MEIVTKAKELKGMVEEKDLQNLEIFFANTNLSNDEREKLVGIIDDMLLSTVKLFLKENGFTEFK